MEAGVTCAARRNPTVSPLPHSVLGANSLPAPHTQSRPSLSLPPTPSSALPPSPVSPPKQCTHLPSDLSARFRIPGPLHPGRKFTGHLPPSPAQPTPLHSFASHNHNPET
ncbi:hypothetical protein P171DRAFT_20599 [Karstenula rhodostoma CBS 690.94]|uniref:Uncharacterized protein n=1 Tax=Karstenula rhodostoma CBS 690.94 TaxID=1392251 RepID=A0A9P4PVJ2_9PLEO|nr:hypothetical protein P171DRAFT_20599 [Karstenula rhodostoma CBS 690.94]